jgi:hypothetical protein
VNEPSLAEHAVGFVLADNEMVAVTGSDNTLLKVLDVHPVLSTVIPV